MTIPTITRHRTVARYEGDLWLATYPCGHEFAVSMAPTGECDKDGFYPGWWRCPEPECTMRAIDSGIDFDADSDDHLRAVTAGTFEVIDEFALVLDEQQRLELADYVHTVAFNVLPELAAWDEFLADEDDEVEPPAAPATSLLAVWGAHLESLARIGNVGQFGGNVFGAFLAREVATFRLAWLREAHALMQMEVGMQMPNPFDCGDDDIDPYGHWHYRGGSIHLPLARPMGG